MNFTKILDFMANKNIDQSKLFSLVDTVKKTDLSDENNIKEVITKVCSMVNKTMGEEEIDNLVRKIKSEGIPKDIFSLFK